MAKLTLHLSRTNVLAGVGGWSTWPSHLECLLHAGYFQKIMLRWNLGDRQCNPWGAGEYLWAKSSLSRSTTKGKEASVHNHRHRPRRSSSTSAKCTTRGGGVAKKSHGSDFITAISDIIVAASLSCNLNHAPEKVLQGSWDGCQQEIYAFVIVWD